MLHLRDRTRWGPIWAGALVVLTTYLVLQLLFFALGILDLDFEGGRSGTVARIVSGILALAAFFLGGFAAGASHSGEPRTPLADDPQRRRRRGLVSLLGVRTAILISVIPGLLAAAAIVFAVRQARLPRSPNGG